MGWALVQAGRLDEGKSWLDKAWAGSEDPEVAAHLGETLWRMGRTAEAKKLWDEALADKSRQPPAQARDRAPRAVTRRLAALALVLLAGGCATLPAPAPGDDWPARRAALQALDAWALDGRIAVAAGEDGFSGGFDWHQQGERADIALTGPMGGAAMDIRAEGDQRGGVGRRRGSRKARTPRR